MPRCIKYYCSHRCQKSDGSFVIDFGLFAAHHPEYIKKYGRHAPAQYPCPCCNAPAYRQGTEMARKIQKESLIAALSLGIIHGEKSVLFAKVIGRCLICARQSPSGSAAVDLEFHREGVHRYTKRNLPLAEARQWLADFEKGYLDGRRARGDYGSRFLLIKHGCICDITERFLNPSQGALAEGAVSCLSMNEGR